jgi:DNA excision repair protein ERCC-6
LFCPLTEEQRIEYEKYLRSEEVESVLRGSKNLLSALTVLRKICNHPDLLLVKEPPRDYGNPTRSGKISVISKILPVWKSEGHRVLLFTQTRRMLDIIEDYCANSVCFKFCILDMLIIDDDDDDVHDDDDWC